MKKLSILLILMLSATWAYTSWYWYTCKIKWLCLVERLVYVKESTTNSDATQRPINEPSPEAWNFEAVIESGEIQVDTGSKDILVENKTSSWLSDTQESDTQESDEQNDDVMKPEEVVIECVKPLSKAISLGWESNDTVEVKRLEEFLNNNEGESLEVDGRYSQEDYEAVKRFQLKYRADILDPWNIDNPTGYVYTTTIKKVNELACKK